MKMKRQLWLLLSICLLWICSSASGQAENDKILYYPSGKLEAERKYDKSCNCDKLTEYYESGKIRSTATYLRKAILGSQLDGAHITYFENGIIQLYTFYKAGALSGRIYANFPDGKLAYEQYFADSFKTGRWKFYNTDGGLKEELVFDEKKTPWNSQDDDAVQMFYTEGKLIYTVKLIAGKKSNLTIIDKDLYNRVIAAARPDGKKLFQQECAMCHNANVDIVGPKMQGVAANRTREWLVKMITNGEALRKSGDKAATDLYAKWRNMEHPNFERLDSGDVDAIIAYLNELK